MSLLFSKRNVRALTAGQIKESKSAWKILGGERRKIKLILKNARQDNSKTTYNPARRCVNLGADAFPSSTPSCHFSGMSLLACLAHELAHAERHKVGIKRPFEGDGSYIEEVEASLHASLSPALAEHDRLNLICYARSILNKHWESKC
ncbi:MAG: hypothetical protein HY795_17405 [Desulfovibrio sp.]|nr:hypothetical protein [Desulfovibrio sp.]MBI4958815.1 hypothetical protein [Desulfovibrio sp.]